MSQPEIFSITRFAITAAITCTVGGAVLVLLCRGRRDCTRCKGKFNTFGSWDNRDLCAKCAGETEKTSRGSLVGCSIWLLFIFLVIPGIVTTSDGILRALWRLGKVATVLVLVILLLNSRARRALFALFRALFREIEGWDFAAARKASGCSGRVFYRKNVAFWTDADDDVERDLEEGIATAREAVTRITCLPPAKMRPLRVLCFRSAEASIRYMRAAAPEGGHFAGYYGGLARKRIVLCGEWADLFPSTLCNTMAHETTHHLLWRRIARPPWLQEGLAMLAARIENIPIAPGAGLRGMRATMARDELLKAQELFAITYAVIHSKAKDLKDVQACEFVAAFYSQSASFVDFLQKTDEACFHTFLDQFKKRGRAQQLVEECFGRIADDLMNAWLDERRSAPVPPHGPITAEAKQRIDTQLLPLICDPHATVERRLVAVSHLAGAGYLYGAEALVELLATESDPLRAQAQRALENISGEVGRVDKQAWRAWLESARQV